MLRSSKASSRVSFAAPGRSEDTCQEKINSDTVHFCHSNRLLYLATVCDEKLPFINKSLLGKENRFGRTRITVSKTLLPNRLRKGLPLKAEAHCLQLQTSTRIRFTQGALTSWKDFSTILD